MVLTMELRDQAGRVVRAVGEFAAEIPAEFPTDLDPREFPLLAGVDRDEDAVFNRQQMKRLTEELERLLLNEPPPRRRRLIEQLIELCQQSRGYPHAQLWFRAE
jgi:hypothetical protein